eukprot:13981297-Alexandrium_andersonii.AAC.1
MQPPDRALRIVATCRACALGVGATPARARASHWARLSTASGPPRQGTCGAEGGASGGRDSAGSARACRHSVLIGG